MKPRLLFALLLVSLLWPHLTTAAPLDEKLTALDIAIKSVPSNPNGEARGGSLMIAPQLKALIDQGNETEAISILTSVLSSFPDQSVQQAAHALVDELTARRKARESEAAAKIEEVLKKIPDAVKEAKKAQDLDDLLKTLINLRANDGSYSSNSELGKLHAQSQQAYQFVAQWQEYLANRDAGQNQQVKINLHNLAESEYGTSIMPRSAILALITAPPPKAVKQPDALDGINGLEEIGTVVERLRATVQTDPSEINQTDLRSAEQALLVYNNAKAGLPVTLGINVGYDPGSTVSTRLRAMTLLYILPRYIGETAAGQPRTGETVADYLNRVNTAAADSGNWVQLKKVLEAQLQLGRNGTGNTPFLQTANSGVNALLTALNQDAGGQYALAIRSYQTSLSNPNDFIPPKFIGERLEKIKREHPQEYDQGMELVLHPPTLNSGGRYPNYSIGSTNAFNIPPGGIAQPPAMPPSPAATPTTGLPMP